MNDLERNIQSALDKEAITRGGEIDVKKDNGVVCLIGAVSDLPIKRKAAALAIEVAGEHAVRDELLVRPDEHQPDERLRDLLDQVLRREPVFAQTRVGEDASGDAAHPGGWIRFTARDGVVYLEGQLPSLSHRRIAEVLCWWVPGVSRVDNLLQVQPPEEDNDGEISEAIRLVLEMDPSLDAQEISVLVRNATVRLGGVAHSREQAARAERDCWCVPGVHDVSNELQVVGPR